jgi:hypothetical protein
MIRMNKEPVGGEPDFLNDILQQEINNFGVFEAVAANAMIRHTRYHPGRYDEQLPSMVTLYGTVPIKNEYAKLDKEPTLGLVLSICEEVPSEWALEGHFFGESYFNGKPNRVTTPCLTVISSMSPKRAKVLEQFKRPSIMIESDSKGEISRTVLDPSFVLGDRLELAVQQERFRGWLGVLALRIP